MDNLNKIKDQDFSFLPVPSIQDIEKFLAGRYVKGVGEVFARRLVETFGWNVFSVIESEPEKLAEVQGISRNKAIDISRNFKEIKFPIPVLVFLYSCGVSENEIDRILKHYGNKYIADVLREDPYEMVESVWQLHFFTVDKVGRHLGISSDDPRRLRGALLTAIKMYAQDGHLYATRDEALNTASKITAVASEKIIPEIDTLLADDRIKSTAEGLYLPVYYKAEEDGAYKIGRLMRNWYRKNLGIEDSLTPPAESLLTKEQYEALLTIDQNPLTIIIGDAGTGKTELIKEIVKRAEYRGDKVILCAPTRNAANRMTEATGCEAVTLNRLLGHRPAQHYSRKPIEADIVVIDGACMLEQVMFNHFLDVIQPGTRLVIIGDPNQLAAVGAGNVLNDFIKSEMLPVVRLKENHRHQSSGYLYECIRDIKDGRIPPSGKLDDGFLIINVTSEEDILQNLKTLVNIDIPEAYHVQSDRILVLTPRQDGAVGSRALSKEVKAKVDTVHKSQGAEADCVVFILWSGHEYSFSRNLIYSAVSRARKLCVIIGEKRILEESLKKNLTATRKSGFHLQLRKSLHEED